MNKVLKIILVALAALLMVGGIGLVIWGGTPQAAMPEAIAALQSDGKVEVQTGPWLSFKPAGVEPETGLIIYPGAHVDPAAYAPAARAIAAEGYLAVIVPMPLSLAFFGGDRASEVVGANPSVRHWALAGHSLGGVAAASFVKSHPEVRGLVLWASYPADWDSLSNSSVRVTSISGSSDGLSTPAKIAASRSLLPAETRWVEIQGGNHGQFGWYGIQSGDGNATISREEQQAQLVAATIALLKQIKEES